MNRKKYYLGLLMMVLAFAAVLFHMGAGLGCGPYSEIAYFTFTLHPDLPLDSYASGEIGVIQPTYARSYLYVAYRYLSGKKFDADEQKELVELWRDRLAPFSFSSSSSDAGKKDPTRQWIEARKKVPGAGADPLISLFRDFGKNYQSYLNCTDDGFLTATSTLNERIARFGADSPVVKEWLSAQDQVFTNCSNNPAKFRPGNENASLSQTIPAAAQSGAPPMARADREYQIASAYFYSADFDEAARRFQSIGDDANSPWRKISRLLVARCLIRKATLSEDIGKSDATTLAQADRQLTQILNDPRLSVIHPSTQRLHEFIEIRLHPRETEHHLAAQLLQEHVGRSLKQDLWDYTVLMDRAFPEEDAGMVKSAAGNPESGLPQPARVPAGDDMADWLATFQNTTGSGLAHSLEKWKATRSLPWLVASLSKSRAGEPDVAQLLKAAETVRPDSPGYAAVTFHRLRLLSDAHQDVVRTSLDNLLSERRKSLPLSSLNLFLALRMKVAKDLEELLEFAQRVPATITLDEEGMELPEDTEDSPRRNEFRSKEQVLFDADSSEILNTMLPLDILAQAAESRTIAVDLRRQVAQAVWVRAVLLGDSAEAQRITPVWESLDPQIKNYLEAYHLDKSPESARFAAVYFMLKFPGTRPIVDAGVSRETALNRIDSFRDNWWCLPEPSLPRGSPGVPADFIPTREPLRSIYPGHEPSPPTFLSAEQRTKAEVDWKKMSRVAPNYFAQEVLDWGKQHPGDPREPEALYLVVRATRYGCTDGATGGFSKAAFQFLKAHYPKTEWARRTKYWYGLNSGGM